MTGGVNLGLPNVAQVGVQLQSSRVRVALFYGILFVPIAVYLVFVVPSLVSEWYYVSQWALNLCLKVSPILGGDLSVFGEVTPVVLAASIIGLMPGGDDKARYIAILLCVIIYAMYLHLSLFFLNGPGAAILSSVTSDITVARKVIVTLISNVRIMSIVVAASILGFKIKNG
jgi:hypothetical protein